MVERPSLQIFRETFARRESVVEHPLYSRVVDESSARTFMRHHVFAVWDFMSLLKRLQRDLTGCAVPWLPPVDEKIARFINEIVLGEESDESPEGGHASHFSLYRRAMVEVGAPTQPIDSFVARLREGASVDAAFGPEVPRFVREFVVSTCDLAMHGRTHEVVAAFCFGREDVIPEMFRRLLTTLRTHERRLELLDYYVERHIEVDGDHHGPLAMELIDLAVGQDPQRLHEATVAAHDALERRARFWDGVLREVSALPSRA